MALAEREGDEAARAKHLAELHGPGCPPAGLHIWGWFLELHRSRPMGGMDAGSITFSELEAWSRLTGAAPSPWEVEVLLALDAEWFAVRAAARRKA